MKYFKNILTGYVTSIIGLAIICLTAYAANLGKIEWIWNGIAGCTVGAFFVFLSDKTIVGFFKQAFQTIINFYSGKK